MSQDIHLHLDPEYLERYSRGQASEDDTARWEEHLLLCEPCQEELKHVDSFVRSMRGATAKWRNEPEASPWWRAAWPVPAFAALAVLLIGVAVVPRFTGNSQPPLAIGLAATRGAGIERAVPAGRTLAVTPDLTGLPAEAWYRLELVEEQGKPTWQGKFVPSQGAATVPGQRAGIHFVRIYSSSGQLLREYGLAVNP